MADIPLGASALLSSDLQICIYPRDCTSYRGTSQQLVAEGLLPPGFKWPTGDNRITVEVGKFTYSICRARPAGHKGPKSSWTSGNYWFLLRKLTSQPLDGALEATIYAKTKELDAAIYRRTPEFARIAEAAFSALCDDRYKAFRGLFIQGPKRGRSQSAKGTTMQRQGEAA